MSISWKLEIVTIAGERGVEMSNHQWLCAAINDNLISNTEEAADETEYAIGRMADQLNESENVSTTFYEYYPNYYVEYHPPAWSYDETEFIKNCLQELFEEGLTVDGDAWIIIDRYHRFGYGKGGVMYQPAGSNQTLWGARALYIPEAGFWTDEHINTFHNFVIHELGHSFGANHGDGQFHKSTISGIGMSVRPMSTAYVYSDDNDVDTCHEGSAAPPNTFCDGEPNFSIEEWCGDCSSSCRHSRVMTDCTELTIEANSPR